MKIIIFDERCFGWNENTEVTKAFLTCTRDYIMELYNNRDYIYLNQIYEQFGVVWHPSYINFVWSKACGHELIIRFSQAISGPRWYIYVDHKLEKIES